MGKAPKAQATDNPAPAMAEVSSHHNRGAGSTVTVACKIPNGLVLQLSELYDTTEPSPSGARPIKASRKVGEAISVKGPARPLSGMPPDYQIIGGYGLTYGVPADFWHDWKDQNRDLDAVRQNLIFASTSHERAMAQAKDMKTIRSGMEPLDPDSRNADKSFKDPRMVRGIKKHEDNDMESEKAEMA